MNAITVVAPHDHAARIRRIGTQAVWINVAVFELLARAPNDRPIVLIGNPERDPGDSRVVFVVRAAVPDDQLQAVLTAVATGSALAEATPPVSPQNPTEARAAQRSFAASRKLATATDLASTEQIAVEAMIELLDVERAHCLFYDADSAALWSEARERAGGDGRRAIGGLAGWSARTGLPCAAPIAGDDPRYVVSIDDPEGDPAAQIMVQPILGGDSRVHAVLVAIRRTRRAPLGATEAAMLARFAALAAPLLDQLSTHVEGQQLLEGDGEALFRKEAVEAAIGQKWGDVVRVSPSWLSWAYWILVILLAGSIAFVSVGTIATYSTGPAVIRSMARTSLTARTAGNISAVEVVPGDRVSPGTEVARLDDVEQRAAFDRTSREFENQLRNHMQNPSDQAADSSLRQLRRDLEQAQTALEERSIRAATGGVVSDLRVRPGQHVEPGDIAASIVDGNAGLEVVALLPGEDRPQLAPNMTLRLELAGYRYAYQSLMIDSVSSDVIPPAEAHRVLGAEVADSLHLAGPVVLVRGRLASPSFEVDGKVYTYHDGMLGTAEVSVREERILFALVPGMRKVF